MNGHSCSQRTRSLWSEPRKSAIHGPPVTLRILWVKYGKCDWLRIRNELSAHAQKIGPSQRSRFLALTKSNAVSGDENA